MARPVPAVLTALVLLTLPLSAVGQSAFGQDFADEASSRMKLSFDLDEVEERLAEPAAAMPSPYQDPYNAAYMPAPVLPLEPNSDVSSVTVFRDRALVTRVITERLDGGVGSITFEGLPFVLVPDSLNAGLESGAARIVGVELVSAASEVDETERIETIRVEAKTRTDELGQIRDRLESLLAQRSYLRTALLSHPVQGQDRQSLTEVRNTLDYVGEAERDIARQLRKEEERAQELDEELRPLLVKLDNPLATGQTVKVELDADKAGEVEVSLRYQVWGAGWAPSYNARLQGDRMELEYQGVVTQATGEDWEDVELLLSTANPSVAGTMPVMNPWYLGRDGWYGGDVGGALEGGRGHYEAPEESTASASPGTGVLESRMEAAVEGSGAVVFAVKGERSVAGDGSAQRIPVGTQTLATTVELTAIPKLVPEVFRQVRVGYDGEVPLLPGAVATYVEGDYVGSSAIAAVVPGEEFELGFGTYDRMKVEREMVSRKQEFIGPGKKTVRYTFHFRVRVSNYSGTERTVEVRDQLPVSEMDRVTVKEIDLGGATEPESAEGSGILAWNLTIPDGQEKQVEFQFSVTAPVGTPELRTMDMLF
jgi:uncharacterized protein (TIGR02231 family)